METVQIDLFTDEPYRGHAPYVMGSDTSIEAAKAQLEFAIQNIASLRRVDAGGNAEKAARSMLSLLKNGETLTPNQLAYCDGLYEKVMKGLGMPSVNVHSDVKRRGLRFG